MTAQLSLFAPRARPAPPPPAPGCPRFHGPLCCDGPRCPGAAECERPGAEATARILASSTLVTTARPVATAPGPLACQDCGATEGVVDYYAGPGVPPPELGGPHCMVCAGAILRRWMSTEERHG